MRNSASSRSLDLPTASSSSNGRVRLKNAVAVAENRPACLSSVKFQVNVVALRQPYYGSHTHKDQKHVHRTINRIDKIPVLLIRLFVVDVPRGFLRRVLFLLFTRLSFLGCLRLYVDSARDNWVQPRPGEIWTERSVGEQSYK